jgi:hypothetical protein
MRAMMAARREGVVFGRSQRHVAVLVVAQFAATLVDDQGAPLLLVKGGSSLELRRGIVDSRTSKELDTVVRQDIAAVHDRLADAGEIGWEGFTAVFTPPEEIEIPGLPIKPRGFTAKLSYRGKPFASVPIEVSASTNSSTPIGAPHSRLPDAGFDNGQRSPPADQHSGRHFSRKPKPS